MLDLELLRCPNAIGLAAESSYRARVDYPVPIQANKIKRLLGQLAEFRQSDPGFSIVQRCIAIETSSDDLGKFWCKPTLADIMLRNHFELRIVLRAG